MNGMNGYPTADARELGETRIDVIALREEQIRLGVWMFLATVTMLFAAFASAYVVRHSGSDWRPIALPSILWLNTSILAASSVTVEVANRHGTRGRWRSATIAMIGALVLGFGFLWGQVAAWQQLAADGLYLPTTPHGSFFYVLTGAHALHVAAALAVLAWATTATVVGRQSRGGWEARIGICRTFWHYLGGVWAFLLALLTL
jgi:cytochrome c oxidase subunit 3